MAKLSVVTVFFSALLIFGILLLIANVRQLPAKRERLLPLAYVILALMIIGGSVIEPILAVTTAF